MSNTQRHSAVASSNAADALPVLSKIYLTSIERLLALQLNTVRDAVEDFAVAAKSVTDLKAGDHAQPRASASLQPMMTKMFMVPRSTYEILFETNREVSKVMLKLFSAPPMAFVGPASWNGISDMFAQGLKQVSEQANENLEAMSRATSKVVATISNEQRAA
jgi:hypothetical protein